MLRYGSAPRRPGRAELVSWQQVVTGAVADTWPAGSRNRGRCGSRSRSAHGAQRTRRGARRGRRRALVDAVLDGLAGLRRATPLELTGTANGVRVSTRSCVDTDIRGSCRPDRAAAAGSRDHTGHPTVTEPALWCSSRDHVFAHKDFRHEVAEGAGDRRRGVRSCSTSMPPVSSRRSAVSGAMIAERICAPRCITSRTSRRSPPGGRGGPAR